MRGEGHGAGGTCLLVGHVLYRHALYRHAALPAAPQGPAVRLDSVVVRDVLAGCGEGRWPGV
jgi:hypothetical protein